MSAGWVALLSPLILDLPCCLVFSEGPGETHVVSVGGGGGGGEWGVHRAEQRRLISSVALYADGLVKRSHTTSRSRRLSVRLSF